MKVMNNVYDMRLCVYQCFVVNMQAVYQACFLVVFSEDIYTMQLP